LVKGFNANLQHSDCAHVVAAINEKTVLLTWYGSVFNNELMWGNAQKGDIEYLDTKIEV
jgi:hypothetical protein